MNLIYKTLNFGSAQKPEWFKKSFAQKGKRKPMKSLTIHNMDADLAKAIEDLAESTGLSQNKVVKKLLRRALNLSEQEVPKRDVSAFFGIWTQEEAEEFEEAVKAFGEIDEEMWQ
ncbi:MAG: hypothetical protein KDD10_08045 [Phaeodactylibacter sp.]|nr:hypothetical protein [Phaeodactylibacter sp.]